MAKVIYFYGCVGCSKSMQLLSIAHNYESCNWNVCTIKPAADTRSELIETRAKVPPRKANIVISDEESLYDYNNIIGEADVILVDECQFLSVNQINELRSISNDRNIDVLCFGLRTDFNANLFPASKRLFEISDEVNEVKTICTVCGKHASFNKKVCYTGEGLVTPSWDAFEARCWNHFINDE